MRKIFTTSLTLLLLVGLVSIGYADGRLTLPGDEPTGPIIENPPELRPISKEPIIRPICLACFAVPTPENEEAIKEQQGFEKEKEITRTEASSLRPY